jgi:type II secretory pathway pseudopilin PulG
MRTSPNSVSQAAFGLIETVVAMALLAMLLLSLAATTTSSVNLNEMLQERRVAAAQAQGVLTRILALQDTTFSTTFTPPTTPVALTFADFGETAPAELNNWTTTVTVASYQRRIVIATGVPKVDPEGPFLGADLSDALDFPSEFDSWDDGNVYEVTVHVTWTPGTWIRSGDTVATYKGLTLSSFYYPSPAN